MREVKNAQSSIESDFRPVLKAQLSPEPTNLELNLSMRRKSRCSTTQLINILTTFQKIYSGDVETYERCSQQLKPNWLDIYVALCARATQRIWKVSRPYKCRIKRQALNWFDGFVVAFYFLKNSSRVSLAQAFALTQVVVFYIYHHVTSNRHLSYFYANCLDSITQHLPPPPLRPSLCSPEGWCADFLPT